MRAQKFFGLLLLALCILMVGCSDERKITYPYRGANYFNQPDDVPVVDTVIAVKIRNVYNEIAGSYAYIPVIKTTGKERMYGFDFLLAYDATTLNSMGITSGPIHDIPGEYEWEYFTYRLGPFPGCDSTCPSGTLRVVAIADQNDGPHHPLEYRIPDATTLFTCNFLIADGPAMNGRVLPVSFFWTDCGDNQILFLDDTSQTDDRLQVGISRYIYNFAGRRLDADKPFPCSTGANSNCDTSTQMFPVRRYVDFWNGAVFTIGDPLPDSRGDLNLNGIPNEIGDAIVFSDYFAKGTAAFVINIDGQTDASDVNGNDIPLEVADFVYLVRVIIGDAIPLPAPILEPLVLTVDSNKISLIATESVGALYLVLEGDIDVATIGSAADMSIKMGYRDGAVRVLLYSFDHGVAITNGEILQLPSAVRIVDVEAASYYGADFKNIIVGEPDDSLIVTADPNPFSDSTIIAFAPADGSGWRIQIYNFSGLKVWEYDSDPGSYSSHAVWKPKNLPAGIYYARITAGSKTGRLTLIYKPE